MTEVNNFEMKKKNKAKGKMIENEDEMKEDWDPSKPKLCMMEDDKHGLVEETKAQEIGHKIVQDIKIDAKTKQKIINQVIEDETMNFRVCVSASCSFTGWLFPGEKCGFCGCYTAYFGSNLGIWKGPVDSLGPEHFQAIAAKWKLRWNQQKSKMRLDWAINTNEGKAFIYKGGMYYDSIEKSFKPLAITL